MHVLHRLAIVGVVAQWLAHRASNNSQRDSKAAGSSPAVAFFLSARTSGIFLMAPISTHNAQAQRIPRICCSLLTSVSIVSLL